MVFSSVLFTYMFLPIVLVLYYLSKERYKNVILFLASLVFYAYGESRMVWLMLGSITVNYFAGLLLGKVHAEKMRKLILWVDIALNLGVLYFFKYLDYTIKIYNVILHREVEILNIALPIGISFFTFQAMSYVIDVFRKRVEPARSILTVGLYISFFPQLVAGPIVRYNAIAAQMQHRSVSFEKFGEGAKRFICGFAKKVLLANNLAMIAERAFSYPALEELPVALAWIGSVAFSLQIFFDFSGYSDMAIGLGKLFGFEFEENFNYPYIAKSVTDFWRRWHISLSSWFRDYVYFPLGGSRVKPARHMLNLLIVWALTGLWHGANISFLAWGLLYFSVLVFEKYLLKPETRGKPIRILWQAATLFIVNCAWVLFNIESLHGFVQYLGAMAGLYGNTFIDDATRGLLYQYGVFLLPGILFSTPFVPKLANELKRSKVGAIIDTYFVPIVLLIAFVWAVSFLILGSHNPFIYFNF